ncbi:alpha/beta hydrolase [Gillisia sp. M10.2A]|uniref:Alpha/beta hydrolase n=1 Tax=Gillisia lutea TaxID=2909668 RepID=A0ABS9EEM7_9FLAO|nr:alpha/beta hydrolase-fold protein [Gillisia lutea]MCF4101318.1 alpha/beta hydrolase [Gillisia lutea]
MKICLLLLISLSLSLSAVAQSTASKNISIFNIEAPQLDTIKKIWVYLPAAYSNKQQTFPVLYLQDAQNLFDNSTSYAGEWRVDEILDSLQLELIVIGIEHGNEKRIDELTPFPHPEYKGGNADNYLDFITSTLQPEIKERFQVKEGAENTFIGGSSLGGLFAYYALLKYPHIFGKAVIFSPSFWFSDEIYTFTKTRHNSDLLKSKFFFRAGEKESERMLPLMNKTVEELHKLGLAEDQIDMKLLTEGQHNEAFWSSLFPQAALWLLEE